MTRVSGKRPCPKCDGVTLRSGTAKGTGVRIDFCPECRGLWLDKGELRQTMQEAADVEWVPTEARGRSWRCPACARKLRSFHYLQTLVRVEMCDRCLGIWLDAGEFKEIQQARAFIEAKGKLDRGEYRKGTKGAFLRFIENALKSLQDF